MPIVVWGIKRYDLGIKLIFMPLIFIFQRKNNDRKITMCVLSFHKARRSLYFFSNTHAPCHLYVIYIFFLSGAESLF